MTSTPQKPKRMLTAEQKHDLWLPMLTAQISQADAAAEAAVDRSVITRLRAVARDGAVAALQASRPGRPRPVSPGGVGGRGVAPLGEGSLRGERGRAAGRRVVAWAAVLRRWEKGRCVGRGVAPLGEGSLRGERGGPSSPGILGQAVGRSGLSEDRPRGPVGSVGRSGPSSPRHPRPGQLGLSEHRPRGEQAPGWLQSELDRPGRCEVFARRGPAGSVL